MTTQLNANSKDEAVTFIMTKENLVKTKEMLQACLDQANPLIENGVIRGYSDDFKEVDVIAFIETIENLLKK